MLVDDVAEALKIMKTDVCKTWVSSSIRLRHRANMAVSLMVTTIFASKPFHRLELEELKGRKHLQQVVLLQLIYQIQQEMLR